MYWVQTSVPEVGVYFKIQHEIKKLNYHSKCGTCEAER